jgi:chaperonin cofactor prefoldin
MKGNDDEMSIELLEQIIEKLDRLEKKMDAVDQRTSRIEEKLDDNQPEVSQMLGGVVNGRY